MERRGRGKWYCTKDKERALNNLYKRYPQASELDIMLALKAEGVTLEAGDMEYMAVYEPPRPINDIIGLKMVIEKLQNPNSKPIYLTTYEAGLIVAELERLSYVEMGYIYFTMDDSL